MSARALLVALPLACLVPVSSMAAEPSSPAGEVTAAGTEAAAPARKVVADYLAAVKAKKWDAARKQLHPRRLEDFSGPRKKEAERHTLAAWAHLKEHYLTSFELVDAAEAGEGAVVVSAVEDHFSVEDKGADEGVKVEYLVLALDDRWFLVDRRLGEGVFPARNLKAAYKEYFEYVAAAKPAGKARR
jgi:hypothetical protein